MSFTKEEILNDLDNNSIYEFFLDLEHGYFLPSGSRITLFADSTRWALVFEKTAFGNRTGEMSIELNYFGNCISNLPGAGLDNQFITNTIWYCLIDGNQLAEIEGDFELVSKDAKSVRVRDKDLLIEQDISRYVAKGIEIQDYDNPRQMIDYPALLRFLDEENPELFRATEEEVRTFIPTDLKELMKIDKWYHTPIQAYGGPPPSQNETFQLISDVLVAQDKSLWKPTKAPTNDWRNWPNAGGL